MLQQELRAIEKLEELEEILAKEVVKESEAEDEVFKIAGLEDIETEVHGTLKTPGSRLALASLFSM